MKKYLLLAAFGVASIYASAQTHTCAGGSVTVVPQPQVQGQTCSKSSTSYINNYSLQQSYVPDASTAVKTIKIAFHIWQDAGAGGNWINTPADIAFLNSIETTLNTQFFNANDAPSDPLPGVPFISDSKIRVELENIYFYTDGTLHGSAWNHSAMNSKAKIDHPECSEYLNIHFAGSSTAVFGLQSVDIDGDYYIATSGGGDGTGQGNGNGWAAAQHLSHEIGHALGLCHTWAGSYCTESVSPSYLDLLTDVFAGPPYVLHQSAWGMDPTDPGNTATNNMMGSTYQAGYFSPLQMGRMHRELSLDGVRKYATGHSGTPLEITSNETWDFDTKLYKDLVVKNGATLTIKCLVRFVKEAKVIVEPGGHLIIEGGHLTKALFEDWWGGIYVSGNSNQPQTTAAQGKITIINDGKISYARDAITNIGVDANGGWIWGTTGGIIDANEALFHNNRRDVQLLSYVPTGAKNEKYNASFIDCEFIRNGNYQIESMIPSVTMWNVAGVEIRGCQFRNENNPDWAYEGGAIFTIEASYKVHENISTGCTFNGYADAIRSEGDFSVAFPITVVGANFSGNIHSIYLDAVQNAKIAYNNIAVKANYNYTPPVGKPFQSGAYGIYMNCSNLFLLHDNDLTNPDGTNYYSVGIAVNTNSGAADQVYHNALDNFYEAFQALGVNRSGTNPDIGLNYICNDFGSTTVNSNDIKVHVDGSIAGSQGENGVVPHNRFSNTLSSRHFDNLGPIVKYPIPGLGLRAEPVNRIGLSVNSQSGSVNYNTYCVSRPKPSIVANPSVAIGDIQNIEAQIIQDRNLLSQLIDDGSTPQLEAEILFASGQTEYQNLYIDLMNMAPYVSEENLLNLIEITDFPELALRNIMIANPHSSRSPEVWEALLAREPALSQQTLDDIEGEQQTITAKDVLDMKIAGEQVSSEYLSVQLMQFYAEGLGENTSYLQDLKNHLLYRDEVYFRYALVDLYLSEGNVTAANAALANIANQCEMGGTEDEEYIFMNQFYSVITPLVDNENRLDELNGTAIDALTEIVQNGVGMATGKARAFLALNGSSTSYYEPLIDINGQYKSTMTSGSTSRLQVAEPAFDLYPNPATDHVILQWDWFKAGLTKGFDVYIRDMKGALIRRVEVKDPQVNTKLLGLEGITPGIYLISAEQDDNVVYQSKLTIQ